MNGLNLKLGGLALCAVALIGTARTASAQTADSSGSAEWKAFLLGTQVNVISQHLGHVSAKYLGPNSLRPGGDTKTSHAYGVYAGVQTLPHLDAYLDVEMIRGAGVSQVTGLAGPTNGDVIRQGSADLGAGPYVARAFVRYTMPLRGADMDTLARAMDQNPEVAAKHRLEIEAGKFSLTDLFDLNRYANSTRWQFMNWALFNNTAWDYAADTRGYTNGVAVSWINPSWTLRLASAQMPTRANGNEFDPDLRRAQGTEAEFTWNAPTSTVVRVLGFFNQARMGNYDDVNAFARFWRLKPNIVDDDKPGRTKYGAGLNVEQPLADSGETGLFARLGWSDGRNESFVFTEVDRHQSAGVQVSGVHWGRGGDRLGVAGFRHGIVRSHQEYLALGGAGFLLGDGGLRYGSEIGLESYYRLQLGEFLQAGPDMQYIRNPGYNRDRGAAMLGAVRVNLRY